MPAVKRVERQNVESAEDDIDRCQQPQQVGDAEDSAWVPMFTIPIGLTGRISSGMSVFPTSAPPSRASDAGWISRPRKSKVAPMASPNASPASPIASKTPTDLKAISGATPR